MSDVVNNSADITISRHFCREEENELDRKDDHCVRGRGICASDCIGAEQMQHELQKGFGESSSYHKSSDCEGQKLFETNVEFPADFFHGEENVNNNAAKSLQIVCREDLSEDPHSNKEDKGNSSNADLDSGLDGSGSDPSIAGDPDQDPAVNLDHREDGCCRDNGGGKSNDTDGSGHDGSSSSSGNSEQNGGGENSQAGGRDAGSQGGASGGSDGGVGGAGGGAGGGGGGGDEHPDRRIEEKRNPRKKKKKKDQKKQADQHGESSDDEACLQSYSTGRLVHNQPATSDSATGLSKDRPQSASSPDSSNTSSVNDGVVWTNESEPRGNGPQRPASPLPVQRTQETMRVPIQCTEHSVEDLNPDRPVSSSPIAAECITNSEDDDHKIGGGPPTQCSGDVAQTRRAGATVALLPSHHNSERCQLDLVHISPGNLFNLRPNAGLLRQCQEDVHKERLRRAVEENRRLCRRLSCQACFQYRYRYLLLPCAHLVCPDCAVTNLLCPKCRKTIEQRIGVSNGP
ncbi:uncharacterized protein [Littorina saxatilis]|uniref:uncharacterized protein n=1 Tax=Littorina saxatilis TaxID=31220 RepID=UPI0038B67F47